VQRGVEVAVPGRAPLERGVGRPGDGTAVVGAQPRLPVLQDADRHVGPDRRVTLERATRRFPRREGVHQPIDVPRPPVSLITTVASSRSRGCDRAGRRSSRRDVGDGRELLAGQHAAVAAHEHGMEAGERPDARLVDAGRPHPLSRLAQPVDRRVAHARGIVGRGRVRTPTASPFARRRR